MAPSPKKIFIVDDHPLVRDGLKRLIEREADLIVVGEAGDSSSALLKIKATQPELILIDIHLPGLSGIDLTTTLLSHDAQLLILILSMSEESLHADRVLKAGAKGYVMKDKAVALVVTAIRKVLSGGIYLSESMRDNFLSQRVETGKVLSNREWEVLALMAQGLLTRQIGAALHVSSKTIDTHYANMKLKLNLKNLHQLMRYAVTQTVQA